MSSYVDVQLPTKVSKEIKLPPQCQDIAGRQRPTASYPRYCCAFHCLIEVSELGTWGHLVVLDVFATWHSQNGSPDSAAVVFQRALKALPGSSGLCVHCILNQT